MLIAIPRTIATVTVRVGAQPTAPIPPLSQTSSLWTWKVIQNDIIVTARMETRAVIHWLAYIKNAQQSSRVTGLSQQLNTEAIVTLWELDLSRYGLGIARFTDNVTENGQPLKWGGLPYYPVQCIAEGFTRKGTGPNDRPTLRLTNTTKIVTSLVIEGKDLVGCTIKRIRTFRRFLDDGVEPSTLDHWPIEEYVVDRKKGQDKFFTEFELTTVLDQEGTVLPKRQVIRDYCNYVYRLWDKDANDWRIDKFDPCPYSGDVYFDAKGEPVAEAAKDRCGKRLNDCRARYGLQNQLPFRGFPGVARVR